MIMYYKWKKKTKKQGDTPLHQPGVANTLRMRTTISPGQLATMDIFLMKNANSFIHKIKNSYLQSSK